MQKGVREKHIENKTGQFYLIAALIVGGLVIGLASIQNYSIKTEITKTDLIKKELSTESVFVLEYAAENSQGSVIEDFSSKYSEYTGGGVQIIYLAGKRGEIDAYYYEQGQKKTWQDFEEDDNVAKILINDREYKFWVNPGFNFEFVIIQEVGEETIVKTS